MSKSEVVLQLHDNKLNQLIDYRFDFEKFKEQLEKLGVSINNVELVWCG